ncbi:MAG: PD40 domain-containing protein [Armatimonadetes bacterium]|nr:PD40 domain-containing protein [Armatimonadota bacterium]
MNPRPIPKKGSPRGKKKRGGGFWRFLFTLLLLAILITPNVLLFTPLNQPFKEFLYTLPLTVLQAELPQWTSNGKGILFLGSRVSLDGRKKGSDLYLLDLEGGGQVRPITSRNWDGGVQRICLSPDGRKILVAHSVKNGSELLLFTGGGEETGTQMVRLNRSEQNRCEVASSPQIWSPDSRVVLYHCGISDKENRVWQYDTISHERKMLPLNRSCSQAVFSPDGNHVAMEVSLGPANSSIMTCTRDGQALAPLTPEGDNHAPQWSPDGTRILYVSREIGNTHLRTIGADGQDPQELAATPQVVQDPLWSPDGRKILFQAGKKGDSQLVLISSNGAQMEYLTRKGDYSHPAWQKLDSRIAYSGEDMEYFTRIAILEAAGGRSRYATPILLYLRGE